MTQQANDSPRTELLASDASRREEADLTAEHFITTAAPHAALAPDTPRVTVEGDFIPPAHRLVVLVFDAEDGEMELARRIWLFASPRGLDVLYLSLNSNPGEEPLARRRLATLAALTRDARTRVETMLSFDRDWRVAVRRIARPQDVVICSSEQIVTVRGHKRQPLDQVLASELDVPVIVLWNHAGRVPHPPATVATRRALGALPYLIVAGFFALQLQIAQLPRDGAYYVLMCLSVLVEAGLIMLCVRSENSVDHGFDS
jgi:hypothetical protein